LINCCDSAFQETNTLVIGFVLPFDLILHMIRWFNYGVLILKHFLQNGFEFVEMNGGV